jgi:hypothetical protein
MKKGVGSGVGSGSGTGSGSISQRYGSGGPDPDPRKNVTDPQHCLQRLFSYAIHPSRPCPTLLNISPPPSPLHPRLVSVIRFVCPLGRIYQVSFTSYSCPVPFCLSFRKYIHVNTVRHTYFGYDFSSEYCVMSIAL